MTPWHRQSLVAYGQPLCETVAECPVPRGSEVLVRVECCGVCHSDLHLQDGYFSLGGDKRLDITKDRALPFTLGHEIAGVIEAAGAEADGAATGRRVAIYPWIGCGTCAACRAGAENLCSAARHLGVAVDGGYASHVLVPHPRYLLDYAPLPTSFAATLMCSGLTAYGALKELVGRADRGPILLVGLGGVGMMGLALARAMFKEPPIVADIDAEKREGSARGRRGARLRSVRSAGPQGVNGRDRRRVLGLRFRRFGKVAAICDRRARPRRQSRGHRTARRQFFASRRHACDQGDDDPRHHHRNARRRPRSARSGARENIAPIPTRSRPLREAQAALDDLRAGRIVGRTVLSCPMRY